LGQMCASQATRNQNQCKLHFHNNTISRN
jgi:hypothetical protein